MLTGAPVNVKDYGATGNGVTDDTAAIKAALAAGAGKGVYFPSGTYIIWKASTDNTYWLPISSNTEIFGDGATSIIKIKDGWVAGSANAYNTPFWLSGVSNVSIHDLQINGNKDNITHDPEMPSNIYVLGQSENIKIYNNTLINPGNDCVTIGSLGAANLGGQKVQVYDNICRDPGRSCVVMTSARDVIVSGNLMYNAVNSYVDIETDIAGTYVTNVTIDNNIMRSESGIVGTALGCSGPGVQSDIVFANNVCKSCQGMAIGGTNNTGLIISNNYLDGSYEVGNKFFIEAVTGLANSVIANNTIVLQGSATGGMWLRDAVNVIIDGNTIKYAYYDRAIKIDGPGSPADGSVKVINNSIVNCYTNGIFVGQYIKGYIHGNLVDVSGGTGYGIKPDVQAYGSIVSNNTVIGNTSSSAIEAVLCPNINIVNNNIVGGSYGIHYTYGKYAVISNNNIKASASGIVTENSSYLTIADNVVTACTSKGMDIDGDGFITIDANQVMNSDGSGILVRCSDLTITNNLCSDNQVSKTQTYGLVATSGTLTRMVFANNNLANNAAGAISTFAPATYWPTTGAGFATDSANFNRLT